MGKLIVTYRDYDGEVSTANFPSSDLTALNIDAEETEVTNLRVALGLVLLGKEQKYTHVSRVSPQGVGSATNTSAQRESKALVRYYDSITFERATLELPCPDLSKQHVSYPGVFFKEGDFACHADWLAVKGYIEGFVPGPGGNVCVVESIVHVGRNI